MLIIRGGTVVTAGGEARADVLVDGERIAAVGPDLSTAGAHVLEAGGRLVMPGAVDPHVHMALPIGGGRCSSDDFASGSLAALVGGTTTLIDFATPAPGQSLRSAAQARLAEAAASLCDWSLHASVTAWRDDTAADMAWCADSGLPSFKVYLAYLERGLGLRDCDLLRVMETAAALGSRVLAHCENGDAVTHLTRRLVAAGWREPRFHAASRPPELEAEAAGRAVMLAALAGCPLYVVHVSTEEALAAVRRGRVRGARVHAEACTHHLLLDERCYDRANAADFVMSPPLRPSADRAQLWRGLADGDLDVVSSDHCPFLRSVRLAADFSGLASGVGGVEHRLPLLWTAGVAAGRISASRFVELVSTAPARLFGLRGKGVLDPGADADLVIWDPAHSWQITAARQRQRCDTTPFEGFGVEGRAESVLLRGRIVVEGGAPVGTMAPGRFVAREPVDGGLGRG